MDRNEGLQPEAVLPPDAAQFVDNLYNSMFPGENVPSSEDEFAEALNQTQTMAADQFNPLGTSSPTKPSENRNKRKVTDIVQTSSKRKGLSSEEDVFSLLRRSTRIRTKKTTLERLLEVPSCSTQRQEIEREKYFVEVEEERKQRRRLAKIKDTKHKKEMERLRKLEQDKERETEELILLADNLRKELTEEKIDEIFNENVDYFDDVKSGNVENWRHSLYISPGLSEQRLRFSMVGPPFTDAQQDYIYEKVKRIWLRDPEMYMENNYYVSYVLLPTIMIRIYQVFMELESFEEADRRINNSKASMYHDNPNGSNESL